MNFTIIPGYDHPEALGALFQEYTDMLVQAAPNFRGYLALQNYDEELSHLREKYERLYLALTPEGQAAGCIALHRLDDARCELKRLYVRPQYRKDGLGSLLTEQLLADAVSAGYRTMLLDTFPFLESAVRLYRRHGFTDAEQYNNNPIPGEMIFLEKTL